MKEFIGEDKIEEIISNGKSENTDIIAYDFTVKLKEDKNNKAYISISEKGGHVVFMNYNRDVNAETITQEKADEFGKKFLKDKGFDNMKETYYLKESGIVTINYAYEQDGVTIYSDLIKLKVALDNGEVLGIETKGYLNSHEERNIQQAKISKEQAKEKFAGAEATYTIEALMHDCKALQSGTSHNFGNGFAKAFGIEYTNKENKLSPVYETSWGMSTRIIGAIIMVHGDDSGLVLPPRIAPVQTMIIPIQQKKDGVLDKAFEIRDTLKSNFSVKVDDSDKSPGWKFSEQEIQGIPTRIEIGPKDIEKGQAVIVRRDTREKIVTPIDKIPETLTEVLETMQNDMYNKAKAHLEKNTHIAHNWEEFNDILENQQGFIRAMWCGEKECEEAIKDENGATTRCIPFVQAKHSDVCVHCGKPAKCEVYFGKAY